MSTEANKALFQRWVEEGWPSDDPFPIIDEIFSEDVVIQSPTFKLQGRDQLKQHVINTRAGFHDIQGEVVAMVAEGDSVGYHWIFSGVHKGEFMGAAPTGKRITITVSGICRIVDGKFVEARENLDALGMKEQIGAI